MWCSGTKTPQSSAPKLLQEEVKTKQHYVVSPCEGARGIILKHGARAWAGFGLALAGFMLISFKFWLDLDWILMDFTFYLDSKMHKNFTFCSSLHFSYFNLMRHLDQV